MKIKYCTDNPSLPNKNTKLDSGFDLYTNAEYIFDPGERKTISLDVAFEIKFPWYMQFLRLFGLGVEAQIRPKSGRSKNGWDVEIGTVDEEYRGKVGATITNRAKKRRILTPGDKICQIVFVPVFNNIKLIKTEKINEKTSRSSNGFGSSGERYKSPAKGAI